MNQVIIENKVGKIKLNDTVTKQSIGKVIDEIGKLFGATASNEGADFGEIMNAAENGIDTLNIEINSPGGSIFDGYTMYQEIKSLQDRGVYVTAIITGMAASMASVICMACDEVQIVPHGRMMIHDASVSASGNAESLRKSADLVDGLSDNIANIYATKTGIASSEIRTMMKAETWMNAVETVAMKFADKITEKKLLTQAVLSENRTNDMINLFGNKADIEAAQSQIVSLETDLTNSQNELTASNELVASQAQSIADLQSSLSDVQSKFDEAQNAVTQSLAEIESLKLAVEIAEASAATKAAEMVAQTGIEPVTINEAPEDTRTLREKINALPTAEARQSARLKNWDKL